MYIEKTQHKISNISTYEGFRGCIIQTLKPQKTIETIKKTKKTRNLNLFFKQSWCFPLLQKPTRKPLSHSASKGYQVINITVSSVR